jgi:hypothetical protein
MKASKIRPNTYHVDPSSYKQMKDSLILVKILAQSDAAYRKGNWKSQKEVEADFKKRFPG